MKMVNVVFRSSRSSLRQKKFISAKDQMSRDPGSSILGFSNNHEDISVTTNSNIFNLFPKTQIYQLGRQVALAKVSGASESKVQISVKHPATVWMAVLICGTWQDFKSSRSPSWHMQHWSWSLHSLNWLFIFFKSTGLPNFCKVVLMPSTLWWWGMKLPIG